MGIVSEIRHKMSPVKFQEVTNGLCVVTKETKSTMDWEWMGNMGNNPVRLGFEFVFLRGEKLSGHLRGGLQYFPVNARHACMDGNSLGNPSQDVPGHVNGLGVVMTEKKSTMDWGWMGNMGNNRVRLGFEFVFLRGEKLSRALQEWVSIFSSQRWEYPSLLQPESSM